MHGFWNGFFDGYSCLSQSGWGGGVMMFVGLVIFGVVLYLLFKHREGRTSAVDDSALETLKKRFVNGEIGVEEYEEKKRILTES